jgi:hypothetical protein
MHFHWGPSKQPYPTHLNSVTWSSLPEDQHPDIFLVPSDVIETCFSLYHAAEMSWTYVIRVQFHRADIADDGVERWVADTEGGWEMYYGTLQGPMEKDIPPEQALKTRRVCPTCVVVPLAGLARMLLSLPRSLGCVSPGLSLDWGLIKGIRCTQDPLGIRGKTRPQGPG